MAGNARRKPAQDEALSREALLRKIGRLEGQIETMRDAKRGASWASVAKTLIRSACLVLVCWVLAYYLAGKSTSVWAMVDAKIESASLEDIAKALAPSVVFDGALFVLSVVITAINFRYRRTIKSQARRLGNVTEMYEKLIDPERSSSGLSESGGTNEKDEI